jgi:hypothetical protein
LTLDLSAFNATNAQVCNGGVVTGSASDGVSGAAGTISVHKAGTHNGIAEDSTADKALAVTAQLGASSASLSFRALTAVLELLD